MFEKGVGSHNRSHSEKRPALSKDGIRGTFWDAQFSAQFRSRHRTIGSRISQPLTQSGRGWNSDLTNPYSLNVYQTDEFQT